MFLLLHLATLDSLPDWAENGWGGHPSSSSLSLSLFLCPLDLSPLAFLRTAQPTPGDILTDILDFGNSA